MRFPANFLYLYEMEKVFIILIKAAKKFTLAEFLATLVAGPFEKSFLVTSVWVSKDLISDVFANTSEYEKFVNTPAS